MKTPESGDIIRIAIGEIYHYGIYVSDDEVIQFGLPPVNKQMLLAQDIKVLSTDIEGFICGNFLEVASLSIGERIKARKPKDVVAFARSRIGVGGYNLLHNNCEHFVNECVFGEKKSSQVDEVRLAMQRIPKIDVYFCRLSGDIELQSVLPPERQREIEECTNERVKKQKYCAWRLLGQAFKSSYNTSIEAEELTKNSHGKWCWQRGGISLSHNDEYAVAAISNYKIGVDVESISSIKFSERLFSRIATKKEQGEEPTQENLALMWTRKESIFKKEEKGHFDPKNIESTQGGVKSFRIDDDNILSVACDLPDNICFYSVSCGENWQIKKTNLQEV